MNPILKLYGSLFDVKPYETKKTVLLQVYIFILITTLLVVKPSINSIFLSELGSDVLPLAYLFTAVFAILFSLIYNRLTGSIPIKRLMLGTLWASIGILLLFSYVLHQHPGRKQWLYLPYIFVAIYGLLSTSQFWLLSNLVFNIRQAKRLFGLIGSGAIAGGIFGGYLTSILSRFIDTEYLLVVAAVLLAFCIPINRYLWKNLVPKVRLSRQEKRQTDNPLKSITRTQLLKHMTIALAISVFVAKLVDFQFSHFAAEKFQDTEALTAFFGFWFSTLSIISLVIQAVLTKRVLSVFGLKYSLLLYPSGILISSALLLIFPELWVVILLKVVDGSLKQSLNKASFELLSLPIPLEIKRNTKVFIDVVVDSIATGLAGIMLYIIIHKLDIGTAQISFLTIGLAIIWIVFILRIYKDYLKLFKSMLLVSDKPKSQKKGSQLDPALDRFHETADNILLLGEPSQKIFVLQKMLEHPDPFYNETLTSTLSTSAPEVQTLIIKNLYFQDQTDVSFQITNLLESSTDKSLILELFRYLIHKRAHIEINQLNNAIASCPHPKAKLIALEGMCMEAEHDEELSDHLNCKSQIENLIQNKNLAKEDLEFILPSIAHLRFEQHYSLLDSALKDDNTDLKRWAITAMGISADERFITPLILQLGEKPLLNDIKQALNNYPEIILSQLVKNVIEFKMDLPILVRIPWLISGLQFNNTVETLVKLIEAAEYSVAINAIDAIHHMELNPEIIKPIESKILNRIIHECDIYKQMINGIYTQKKDSSVDSEESEQAKQGLISLLEHRLDSQLKRIFKLIGVKYSNANLHLILESSVNKENDQRANALEYLDNILAYDLKRLLFPILDFVVSDDPLTTKALQKLELTSISTTDCFKQLIDLKDRRIKHAVLYLITQLEDSDYSEIIESLKQDEDPIIQAHTITLLEGHNAPE